MSGIYIHIPFCKQACHYCDFHFSTSLKNKEVLLSCIEKELYQRSNELEHTIVETIYFGGGTPSMLNTVEINSILEIICENFQVVAHPEITLEANPDDLSLAKIQELSKTKINRLSIGIQSFFDEDLQMMNRAHSAAEAEASLLNARRYFENITIDLIYGVPNLTNERWKQNLEKAFLLDVQHISSYALTVEAKTALATFIQKKQYPPLDEKLALEHFQTLVMETTKKGFVHYEISNFGKPNYFSKHNTAYWKQVPYLGVGPSAHSFDGSSRSWNVSNNAKYIKGIVSNSRDFQIEELTLSDRYNEYVMTGLRTIYGVTLDKLDKNFGTLYAAYFKDNIIRFIENETLVLINGVVKTTQKGKFLADGIASELFYIDGLN